KNVVGYIEEKGTYLKEQTIALTHKHGLEKIITIQGRPFWSIFFVGDDGSVTGLEIKSYIQQELLRRGFLWYGQHNMSFSHAQEDIDALLGAYDEVFALTRKHLDSVTLKDALEGTPITDIFKVR
ncbi:MAG: aspartate aminotransferase family protein, partial [Candidatus Magasanikbacteria bacterium CG10_big_fil_rev_8_21_14_0_10_43_6]